MAPNRSALKKLSSVTEIFQQGLHIVWKILFKARNILEFHYYPFKYFQYYLVIQ